MNFMLKIIKNRRSAFLNVIMTSLLVIGAPIIYLKTCVNKFGPNLG